MYCLWGTLTRGREGATPGCAMVGDGMGWDGMQGGVEGAMVGLQ